MVPERLLSTRRAKIASNLIVMASSLAPPASFPDQASPTREPVIFNLDDEGASTKLQRPSSLEVVWRRGMDLRWVGDPTKVERPELGPVTWGTRHLG